MAVNAHGILSRMVLTEGSRNDCTQASELIRDINAENLIDDKAYDTNDIVESATQASVAPVILSKRNRKTQRDLGKDLYKLRHIVENTF